MLKEERQRQILQLLSKRGRVVAVELSESLGTSEDTIRRDLRELSEQGLLQRVHGGALQPTTTPLDYSARARRSPQAKSRLAEACVELLRPGQVIILDGGTTAEQVAHHLPRTMQATVVTNSPAVALALASHPHLDILMPEGRFFQQAQVLVGAACVAFFRSLHADVCVLGAGSVHPLAGVSILDYEEVSLKKAMMAAATETFVLADADKLGKAAPFLLAPLSAVHCLITEREVGEETLAPYRDSTRVLAV